MKMSFTKKPMKPMTMKPQAVLNATFVNSVVGKKGYERKELEWAGLVRSTMIQCTLYR